MSPKSLFLVDDEYAQKLADDKARGRAWHKILNGVHFTDATDAVLHRRADSVGIIKNSDDQLLLVHRSAIEALAAREKIASLNLYTLIVSGDDDQPGSNTDMAGAWEELPASGLVYYRKHAVLSPEDNTFKKLFGVFWRRFEETSKPQWYLLEPASTKSLSALSILCQGYLVVHAALADEGQITGSFKEALSAMGWSRSQIPPDMMNLLTEQSQAIIELVENRDWWPEITEGNLMNQLESEWGETKDELWQKLEVLLMSLNDEGLSTVQIETVSQAYCALSLKLMKGAGF